MVALETERERERRSKDAGESASWSPIEGFVRERESEVEVNNSFKRIPVGFYKRRRKVRDITSYRYHSGLIAINRLRQHLQKFLVTAQCVAVQLRLSGANKRSLTKLTKSPGEFLTVSECAYFGNIWTDD